MLTLTELSRIEIYIGAKGPEIKQEEGTVPPGYNGGGSANSLDNEKSAGAGGGGTDVRIGGNTLLHRVIVAGGGSGGSFNSNRDSYGGAGGGVEGKIGLKNQGSDAYGGNQTSPGIGEAGYGTNETYKTHSGIFGYGGYSTSTQGTFTGGGGGWYGGAGGAPSYHSGGGGGSGYVLSENSYKPYQYPHNNSKYYFTKTLLADGTQMIPIPSINEYEIGHSGNGAFKLTILYICTQKNPHFFYHFHYLSLVTIFLSYK